MKMAYSTSFWKYALLTLNILISMLGLLFVSCGVVALGGIGSTIGAYATTVLGSLVLTICFLGCCASLRESYLLSMIFVGTAALGIVLQLMFMIALGVLKDDFMDMGAERIASCWEQELEHTGAMDKIQHQYSCCGKESPKDYIQDEDDVLPMSCCLNSDCTNSLNIFSKGCTDNILNFFDDQSDNMILISLGVIVCEIFSLASAWYLGKSVQHRVTKMEQIIISE